MRYSVRVLLSVDAATPQEAIQIAVQKCNDPAITITGAYTKFSQETPRLIVKKPGDILALAIRKTTGTGPCPNKCRARIAQMNEWGWWKCWLNRKTIAGWLSEEAARRGHQITDDSALDFLKAAFKELRKSSL
jgi:hypothetical protein